MFAMSSSDLIEELRKAIVECQEEAAKKAADEIVSKGVDIKDALEKGVSAAAKELGDRFERGEYFLGELLIAADIMTNITNALMARMTDASRAELAKKPGTVVIASVYGDIHDIGKNLLSQLLKIQGYEVIDLGRDVPSLQVVNRAVQSNANVIALSSLMTTTMPSQKEVIDLLKAFNARDKFVVIVGGGSTSSDWAKEIGADAWGEDAWDGVRLVEEAVRKRRGA
jgi:corrinoid protein of di/trimethylamine methyltransferase